ncbi:MAG: Sugar lactone lactonase YvrE [Streptosporangiaceae bacterium]|nr:Sugar lactone lactonase YvrE [Streptosporangiaceae bacterium]
MADRSGAVIATVFDAGRYRLAEGPRWDARTETLVCVDILGRRILRRGLAGETPETPVESEVGCLALTEDPGEAFADTRAVDGIPDGIAVDGEGRLWCAFLGRREHHLLRPRRHRSPDALGPGSAADQPHLRRPRPDHHVHHQRVPRTDRDTAGPVAAVRLSAARRDHAPGPPGQPVHHPVASIGPA